MGLLMGIRELKSLGALWAIIEGDSAVVIAWGQGNECISWELWSLVYEISEIALEIGCSFFHVPCEQNSVANSLANWGVSQQSMFSGSCIPL